MTRRIWTKPFIKYNLSGDRTVAKSLERKARACVGYLFDQLMPNQKFRSQNWNYADGSRITAFVWRDVLGERARVEIFAPESTDKKVIFYPYLIETGGYLFHRLFSDNRSTNLYIGDSVSEQYSPIVDFNSSGIINEDDIVCPIGVIEYNREIIENVEEDLLLPVPLVGDINPTTYNTTTSRNEPSSPKKVIQWLCPPSLYTGKLRLYIQAIYGNSKAVNYSVDVSEVGGTLSIKGVSISHSGKSGTILITLPGYQYYLCQIAMSGDTCSLNMIPLIAVEGYEELVNLYRDTLVNKYPNEGNINSNIQVSILETMLLAHLQPDKTSTVSTVCSVPEWANDYGSPVAYSWKSTWSGKEASIVLVYGDPVTTAASGQRLILNIEYNTGFGFSASMKSTSLIKATMADQWYVWTPVSTNGGNSFLNPIFYQCPETGDPVIETFEDNFSNFPIYGWYDSNDNWIPVTISASRTLNYNQPTQLGTISICGFGSGTNSAFRALSSSNTILKRTVAAGNRSLNGTVTKGAYYYYHRTAEVVSDASISDDIGFWQDHNRGETCEVPLCASVEPEVCGSFVQRAFSYRTGLGNANGFNYEDITNTSRAAIIIPSRDCEACIIGIVNGVPKTTSQMFTEAGSTINNIPAYNKVLGTIFNDETGLYEADEGNVIWSGYNTRRNTTDYGGFWGNRVNLPKQVLNATKQNTIVLLTKNNDQDIHDQITGYGNGIVDPNAPPLAFLGGETFILPGQPGNEDYISDWEAFFEAPFGICNLGIREMDLLPTISQSAVFGSISGYGRNGLPFNVNNDGYPTLDTFVGWA